MAEELCRHKPTTKQADAPKIRESVIVAALLPAIALKSGRYDIAQYKAGAGRAAGPPKATMSRS
jgi:hypothetical protein